MVCWTAHASGCKSLGSGVLQDQAHCGVLTFCKAAAWCKLIRNICRTLPGTLSQMNNCKGCSQPTGSVLAPQHSVSELQQNDRAWRCRSLQLHAIGCQLGGRGHRLLQLSQDLMHCHSQGIRLQYLNDTLYQIAQSALGCLMPPINLPDSQPETCIKKR